jgi:licheninase
VADAEVATFPAPDRTRWEPGDHPLGRGRLRPANVGYGPGGLALALPAGTLDGGELRGRRPRGEGRFRARLRATSVPGALNAFFLYLHDFDTDSSDELDVEVPAGEPHRALLTVWRRGGHEPVDQSIVALPFDPAAAEHTYEIARGPGARVRFAIDEVTAFTSTVGPVAELHPMFNAWHPDWLPRSGPSPGGFMRVSRYEFAAP